MLQGVTGAGHLLVGEYAVLVGVDGQFGNNCGERLTFLREELADTFEDLHRDMRLVAGRVDLGTAALHLIDDSRELRAENLLKVEDDVANSFSLQAVELSFLQYIVGQKSFSHVGACLDELKIRGELGGVGVLEGELLRDEEQGLLFEVLGDGSNSGGQVGARLVLASVAEGRTQLGH